MHTREVAMITIPDMVDVTTPVDGVVGPPQGRWTYADYAAIPADGSRYEVVNGILYMAPAPTTGDQSANNLFAFYLTMHIQMTGLGRVFAVPTDVELGPGDVVQPDILVVLNGSSAAITPARIVGAPDLVVEIASPSSLGYDRRQKQDAYARAGVAEYWLADPVGQTIELLVLAGAVYQSQGVFQRKASLPSRVAAMPIQVEQFFE
ncbi:MAG: Uma2 family endonuclease [Roseiflexaceae bacterium]|nr:Uma2 family endonuclease [Roseiflexaceae bacterium]